MKASKLRELTIKELEELISKTQNELVEMRFQLTINKLKSNATISQKKKSIARIRTIIAEKKFSTGQLELGSDEE